MISVPPLVASLVTASHVADVDHVFRAVHRATGCFDAADTAGGRGCAAQRRRLRRWWHQRRAKAGGLPDLLGLLLILRATAEASTRLRRRMCCRPAPCTSRWPAHDLGGRIAADRALGAADHRTGAVPCPAWRWWARPRCRTGFCVATRRLRPSCSPWPISAVLSTVERAPCTVMLVDSLVLRSRSAIAPCRKSLFARGNASKSYQGQGATPGAQQATPDDSPRPGSNDHHL